MLRCRAALALLTTIACLPAVATAADGPPLKLNKGDHVVLIGNALAERMQHFGHFETLLHSRFPEHQLYVRNLGWSADEVTRVPLSVTPLENIADWIGVGDGKAPLRPRLKDFVDHHHTLADHKADVVLAFFGFNESFRGEKGLPQFESDLAHFVKALKEAKPNGKSEPRIVLVSPIAHENLGRRELPDGSANNKNLALYTAAMKQVAAAEQVTFVDLFAPSKMLMDEAKDKKLTINGVHLNEIGDKLIAAELDESLFGARPTANERDLEKLRAEVNEKNRQFFFDHRAINGFYIYGGRKEPFGVVNFPAEFAKLRKMIANRDQRIWQVAQGKDVPAKIDDSNTGEFAKIETNFKTPITITSPESSRSQMELPDGYAINLFASEEEFPDLENPVQFCWDAKGRLWVCVMPSYPMYLPGNPPNDKVLILEDTNADGKADKVTTFADGLHVPTGIEIANGGVYVSQQPNLVFLKDTNGDDKADTKEIVLSGFDSGDSHHSIHAFTLDQGGALYFGEGIFHHSQVESPYGPQRVKNAGIFRFEPRSHKLSLFISYGFSNPWGHYVDRWGQNLIADASPGFNYYGTAFSGDLDYPDKHATMKQMLVKQWRPTCGCELVDSRNFPDDVQGNYLLNNCIGFQGVLQYKMKEDGAGFAADPVDPLLKSSDPNVRPVDIEFGPDGALYICDWFNPLVGHMQHSIRDPNRDHNHGRIWRIHYTKKPLVTPVKIASQPIGTLLDYFKTEPEERTRYRIRTELGNRPTDDVLAELKKWTASLDKNDPDYQHHLLETLWLHQRHDVVNEELLQQLLRSPDYRARAAATRVLCYWRDRVKEPLKLLQVQVNDEHVRVRLEAVRALSFFDSQEAIDIATESLIYDQDDYLKYTFNETLSTLNKRVQK
jgi:glucose/arabinose dehydrogenase/lysophospholipase L1-like esterase